MAFLKLNRRHGFVATAAISTALLGAAVWQAPHLGAQEQQSRSVEREQAPPKEVKQANVHHAEQLSEAFRQAAEVAMPTVVTITTKAKVQNTRGGMQGNPFKGTPFEQFFGDEEFGSGPNSRFSPSRQGMGSGVVIDKSGVILTNNHVVEGADEVVVRLADGREFKGTDIKTDPASDLAVVHIKNASKLVAAKIGDSDKMAIGDWVLAIGNPFELEQTVSAGIISGKGREVGRTRGQYLQTDAAINPGNSGGALVNLDGELVGINTAIASSSGSFQGVGFAIPSNMAQWVAAQLRETGKVTRGFLGVGIGAVNSDLAAKFGVERNSGALVSEVHRPSPAADAGLQEGDVITSFQGKAIHQPHDLQNLVERTTVGKSEPITVVRDGKELQLKVKIQAMPDSFVTTSRKSDEDSEPAEERSKGYTSEDLGMQVHDLTPEIASRLKLDDEHGVVVANVEANSPAAEAGIATGNVIMKVARTPVKSVEEFKAAMAKQKLDDGILLLVKTRQGNRFVVVQK